MTSTHNMREAEARLAASGLNDEQIRAIHARAAAQVTERELDEADEIARGFFEGIKKNRAVSRPSDAGRRRSTQKS